MDTRSNPSTTGPEAPTTERHTLTLNLKSLLEAGRMAIDGGENEDVLRSLDGEPAAQLFGRWLVGDIDSKALPEENREFLLKAARRAVSCYWFRSHPRLIDGISLINSKMSIDCGGFTIPRGALRRSQRIGQLAMKLTDPAPKFEAGELAETKNFHYMLAWLFDFETRSLLFDRENKPLPKTLADPTLLRRSLQFCIDYGFQSSIFPSMTEPRNREKFVRFLIRLAPWLQNDAGEIELHRTEMDFVSEDDLYELVRAGYYQAAYQLGKLGMKLPMGIGTLKMQSLWASGVDWYAGRLFRIPRGRKISVAQIEAASKKYEEPLFLAAMRYFNAQGVRLSDDLFSEGKESDSVSVNEIKGGKPNYETMTFNQAVSFLGSEWNKPGANHSF